MKPELRIIGQATGRCDCEREDCHPDGNCSRPAQVYVVAYGMKYRSCHLCVAKAINETEKP